MQTDKVALFGELLRFTPSYFCLSIAAAGVFFFHWWLEFRKTGWKIDYWQFNVLMGVFIPIILLYPFTGSVLQMLATGNAFYQIDAKIDEAFSISLFGYGCLLLGRFAFDAMGNERADAVVGAVFRGLEITSYRNIRSGAVSLLLNLLIAPLFAVVFVIAAQAGFFQVSTYFLKDESFRSLYNLLIFIYPLWPLYYWLRNHGRMSKLKWTIWTLMLLGTLPLGTRSVIFTTVVTCYLLSALANRGAISYTRGVLFFLVTAVVSMALSAIRLNGSAMEAVLGLWDGIFYGNSVSDLRDFSWGLSAWDGHFWLGKTYLAGLMGFVPRVLSSFREEWAIGVVTAGLIGLSPTEHAGIRLDIFGEAYMNFGLIGVFLLAFVNGFTLRYADSQIKERIQCGRGLIAAYVATIPYQITSAFYNSSIVSAAYTFIGMQLAAALVRGVLQPISRQRLRPGMSLGSP